MVGGVDHRLPPPLREKIGSSSYSMLGDFFILRVILGF